MAEASLHTPLAIRAPTEAQLSRKILEVQISQGGRVKILTITQDLKTKDWVCWYFPIKNMGVAF